MVVLEHGQRANGGGERGKGGDVVDPTAVIPDVTAVAQPVDELLAGSNAHGWAVYTPAANSAGDGVEEAARTGYHAQRTGGAMIDPVVLFALVFVWLIPSLVIVPTVVLPGEAAGRGSCGRSFSLVCSPFDPHCARRHPHGKHRRRRAPSV